MQVYKVGEWQFDGRTNRIVGEQNGVELEPQLGQLLLYLIEHRGEVLSRDQLIQEAWPGVVSDAAINQAIAKLRKLLADDARAPKYVETIPKKGYRFIAEVSEITDAVDAHQTELLQQEIVDNKGVAQQTRSPGKSIITAFAILFVLTSIYYLMSSFFLQSDSRGAFTRATPVTSLDGLEVNLAIHPQSQAKVFSHKKSTERQYDLMLQTASQQVPVNLTQTSDITELQPAWSDDGRHLAYIAHGGGRCQVMLAEAPQPDAVFDAREVTECSAFDIQLAWHPDNKRLFFNRRGHRNGPLKIFAYHIDDGRLEEITSVREGITGDVAFALSGDGSTLAVSRTFHWNQSTIWLVDLSNGEETQLVQLPYLD